MSSLRENLKTEFSKLNNRAKEAEKKIKNEANSSYKKIVEMHKKRQKNHKDHRDENAEQSVVNKIQKNSEKIEQLIFHSDFQLTDNQEDKFRRLVAKVNKSYDQLTDAFSNARKKLSDEELDTYFQVGNNIAALSDEFLELVVDDDIESQAVVLETCSQIEESCDTLSNCIEANYYQAA